MPAPTPCHAQAPPSLPLPGRAGHSCRSEAPTWVCRAEDTGLTQIVNGPIAINTSPIPASDPVTAASEKTKSVDRSKGLWTRCDKCGVILYIKHLKEHHHICFGCNHHLKMTSLERIEHLVDPGTWRPIDETLSPGDPLEFTDVKPYVDRIKEAQDKTGMQDGLRSGTGLLHGIPVALGVMDFGYMGGSMGSVVGEKLTRLIEYATQEGMSLIIVCTSGGARMQEGIFSLMQASDKCCGAEMAGGRVGCCGARMAGGRVGCCGAGIAGGRVGCCGTGRAGGRVRCMAACGLLVHGGGGTRGAWWWVDFEFTNAPLESSRLPLGVGVGVGMSEY